MIPRLRVGVLIVCIFLATTLFLGRSRINQQFTTSQPVEPQSYQSDADRYAEQSDYATSVASPEGCPSTAEWLRELAGSPDIRFPLRYARRDIVIRENTDLERTSITKLNERLVPDFQKIGSPESPELDGKRCLAPLTLEVPPIQRNINASHILFGTATTVDRLDASVPFFQRWLANTGARLIVDVKGNDDKPADPKAMGELEHRMRGLGMAVTLVKPFEKKGSNVQRYFSLIKSLYKHKDEETKWYAFIDDDTFFTSMAGLIPRLAQYDHRKRWYLGAVSEEWWTVAQYGWIAMGGGGIFLSPPMIEILNAVYSDCRRSNEGIFGDHQIHECIERHTDTHLTQFEGLHQVDLHGDRSGALESGRQILSFHHWKEGYWSEDGAGPDNIRHPRWFPMDAMSLVSDVCGDTCFLQRWQFGKDTLLTNGYSIAVYPKGHLKNLELFKAEKTWVTPNQVEGSKNTGYDHYLGPLRPALKLDEEKIHYRFMDAKSTKEGGIRQYFRHLGKDGEMDSLIELHWIREGSSNTAS